MRILVTGANGTIGRRLCAYLTDAGHEVFRTDTQVCDTSDEYMRADVRDAASINNVFDAFGPDVVFHLAAECGIENCEQYPSLAVDTNIVGTMNLIYECMNRGCRLINFSTSEVYGSLLDSEHDADSAIPHTAPRNLYAHTKLAAEALVAYYRDRHALDAITVRPFMVYSPDEAANDYRSVLVRFVRAAINGDTLWVHPGAMRAWTHIDDFCAAMVLLLDAPAADYDIGTDDYTTIRDLAERIVAIVGSGEVRDVLELPSGRSATKRGDFSALNALGFTQRVSLDDGLLQVIEAVVAKC